MTSLNGNFRLKDLLILNFINLTIRDKEMVRSWRNCNAIRKYMCQNRLISRNEHLAFIRGLKKDKHNFYWAVKNACGDYIGIISLNKVDTANKNAFFGIYVNPHSPLLNKGAALMRCLRYLSFTKAELHTLNLEVLEDNERAIRFYKKCGFRVQGRLREFIFRKGRWKDILIMGIKNRK